MKQATYILLLVFSVTLSYGQPLGEMVVDKNLRLNFPGAVLTDSSDKNIRKYFFNTSAAGFQLLVTDSFEVYSEADMYQRLNDLLNVFKEKGITATHLERRKDTILGGAKGVYMSATDTSGSSLYPKAQFFYTVQDQKLYALQVVQEPGDSLDREATRFLNSVIFSGKPRYTPEREPTPFNALRTMFWFVVLVVALGFGFKSMVSRKRIVP